MNLNLGDNLSDIYIQLERFKNDCKKEGKSDLHVLIVKMIEKEKKIPRDGSKGNEYWNGYDEGVRHVLSLLMDNSK